MKHTPEPWIEIDASPRASAGVADPAAELARFREMEAGAARLREALGRVLEHGAVSCENVLADSTLNADQHASVCFIHQALATGAGRELLAEMAEMRETIRLQHELMKSAERRGAEKCEQELAALRRKVKAAELVAYRLGMFRACKAFERQDEEALTAWQEAASDRPAGISVTPP